MNVFERFLDAAKELLITFFDISAPDGRPQRPQVLSAPFNKLCWMALNDYLYPFMRFSSYKRYNIITCFMRVSTLSVSGSFCFFIDIDEKELAVLLDKSDATPIEQLIVSAPQTVEPSITLKLTLNSLLNQNA